METGLPHLAVAVTVHTELYTGNRVQFHAFVMNDSELMVLLNCHPICWPPPVGLRKERIKLEAAQALGGVPGPTLVLIQVQIKS